MVDNPNIACAIVGLGTTQNKSTTSGVLSPLVATKKAGMGAEIAGRGDIFHRGWCPSTNMGTGGIARGCGQLRHEPRTGPGRLLHGEDSRALRGREYGEGYFFD